MKAKLLFVLAIQCCASVSSFSLGSFGDYAKISSQKGLLVAVILLKLKLLAELGLLPLKIVGKKKRELRIVDGCLEVLRKYFKIILLNECS